MNWLNFYTKLYGKLHNYSYVPYWVLTPLRRMVRNAANRKLPRYLAKKQKEIKKVDLNDNGIIVSFTSFPARINNVWQVVECMKRQTMKPAKIVLWLSREQFPTRESIPQSLKQREDEAFEICMVDGDIRSHKKYHYVSKEYPNSYVFLIDDDLYYSSKILEKAWTEHLKQPEKVICNYGFRMNFHADGSVKKYKEWSQILDDSDDDNIFFGSGGGTLINPSLLYADLTNIDLALKLTPIADDIWLNTMVRLAGLKVHMISHGQLLPVAQHNNVKLASANNGDNMNDEQLNRIREYYAKTEMGDPYLKR